MTSGVTQGSILEHNLFNIFANDRKETTARPLVRFVEVERGATAGADLLHGGPTLEQSATCVRDLR